MTDRPLSRQMECVTCGHEEHGFFRCELDLGGARCPCPPHLPTGVYPD